MTINHHYRSAFDIAGYTYQADTWCPSCILHQFCTVDPAEFSINTENVLDAAAGERGIDRYVETTFDSDEFPKVIFVSQLDGEDERCGACGGSL